MQNLLSKINNHLKISFDKPMPLDEREITMLLSEDFPFENLRKAADFVRKQNVGDTVHIRGLVELSNICAKDCYYCGIRKSNTHAKRYVLSVQEVVETARQAAAAGFKTIVMQSGESDALKTEDIVTIIKEISSLGVTVTLSLGEKDFNTYKAYKEAGGGRYLLRIETTDKDLYKKLHPDMNFESRVECLKNLKQLGFELGTGILVGLPEQTLESIAKDILFFKEIGADMIGLGPFLPCDNTPLSGEKGGTLAQALRAIAVTRLILPSINIPATTAMEALDKDGRIKALQSGANVIMPNITGSNSILYKLYPSKPINKNNIQETLPNLKNLLSKIGRDLK